MSSSTSVFTSEVGPDLDRDDLPLRKAGLSDRDLDAIEAYLPRRRGP